MVRCAGDSSVFVLPAPGAERAVLERDVAKVEQQLKEQLGEVSLERTTTILGFVMVHVDDLLWSGTNEFQERVLVPLREGFDVGSDELITKKNPVTFLGRCVERSNTGFFFHQQHYAAKLEEVSMEEILVHRQKQ